ncbi:MAG: response regulator [Candidatus Marinimicrobia bacterium]|nr:response regulator [Candidatus Neomarinimicrobiota bacterium]
MNKIALIADDSSTVRKFVSFALKSMGIEVVAASDGIDALEKLSTERFDLVITDLNMPHLDGYELISSIREIKDYEEVPIIILSSESGEEDRSKGFSVGANSYMVKPFDAKKLQYEVSKFLSE